ncbi:MAG TPA: hypothetical protein ENG81_03760 [Candidatus Bathyarchaeota archaeon]|nr:hypothetical protein [Candidatus Bathyarchaeota archaeon]
MKLARTCPECGGEMVYDRRRSIYVCRVCGLAFSRFELDREERRKKREEKDSWKREYLKWWLSSKK